MKKNSKIQNFTLLVYLLIVLVSLFSTSTSIGITELERKVLSVSNNNNETTKPKPKPKKSAKSTTTTTTTKQTEQCSPPSLNKKFDSSECDMVTDGPICLYNGDRVLLPYASPKGLVGYYNFDEIRVLDNSGNRNHGVGLVSAGQAFGGAGSSGLFTSGNYVTIPGNPGFSNPDNTDFSVTFWLFVVQDFFSASKGVRYCPLVQKGKDDLFAKTYQRKPAIYYDRKDKNLKFYIKTANQDYPQGKYMTSNAKVTAQRWLHIGLVKINNKLKLYVNGILDSQLIFTSDDEISADGDAPLYIGNVPWLKDQCDFPFLIDEFRFYNIAVSEDAIQAEASPVLGGIEPSFLNLGCMNCSLKDASLSCSEGYRMCTSVELHTGGYQIARSMGWLDWNTHIWTHGALKTPADFAKLKGLGLCCADLK